MIVHCAVCQMSVVVDPIEHGLWGSRGAKKPVHNETF